MGRHLKNIDYKKRLHKNGHNKRIAGVCSGFADYFEINAFFIRLAFVGSLFFGPFAIFAYIAAAILMDKNPEEASGTHHRSQYVHQRMHPHMSAHMKETINAKVKMAEENMKARKNRHSRYDDLDNAERFNTQDMEKCTHRFSELEQKLRKLEATITSKKFKLHRELKRMQDESTA
jgi:phage shock protein C